MGNAVIDMIVNENALCRRDSAFYRRELTGDVETRVATFDHPDDVPKMPIGTFQTLHDIGMSRVLALCFHAAIYPPRGILQSKFADGVGQPWTCLVNCIRAYKRQGGTPCPIFWLSHLPTFGERDRF